MQNDEYVVGFCQKTKNMERKRKGNSNCSWWTWNYSESIEKWIGRDSNMNGKHAEYNIVKISEKTECHGDKRIVLT